MPDGQALHQLTDDPAFDACPAYSADGKWIAWCRGTLPGPIDIWLMQQNGTDWRQLTQGGRFTFPDISPNGSTVAFMGQPFGVAGPAEIWTVASDGTNMRKLTASQGNNRYPVWSPDGSMIAFLSDRSGDGLQVWVMKADGTDPKQLTFGGFAKDQVPDWSPDGSQLAFVVTLPGGTGGDIWVMNANGSDQHPITSGEPREYGAAWSPDGQEIATIVLGRSELHIVRADGTGRRVSSTPWPTRVPAWQPRGDRLSG
jgi:Tol biopolymer transport system component